MRVTEVTAHAFGPLVGQGLQFHDGLTVIVGGNESAKSSWHAAIYAGICGRKRGKGAPGVADARFSDLHRPWDRAEWKVTASLRLDDGTVLEVVQDLAGKVNCRIIEMPLGTDRSNEWTYDGSVDGSRIVGLNRKAFAATACVAQNDLLKILDDAGALQEMLSRAATSADADESTARALALIDKFKAEQVGLDRSNSSKPLRAALDAVAAAKDDVRDASDARAELETRIQQATKLADAATDARTRHALARAAALAATATDLTDRAARATSLGAELGPDRPAAVGSHSGLVQTISSAVSAWRAVPTPVTPTVDVDTLQGELNDLPDLPVHDTAPAPAVKSAADTYWTRRTSLDSHDDRPERSLLAAPVAGPSSRQLRDLAGDLSRLPAAPAPQVRTLTIPANRTPGLAAAGLGALLAVVGLVLPQPALLALGAVIAIAGGAWAATRKATSTTVTDTATTTAAAARDQARAALESTAASYGVPLDMTALLDAITRTETAEQNVASRNAWVTQRAKLAGECDAAAEALAQALTGRDCASAAESAWDDWLTYEKACSAAAAQQASAGRRAAVEARLSSAQGAVERHNIAVQAVADARNRLLSVVRQAGSALPDHVRALADEDAFDADALAGALGEWTEQVAAADEAAAATADRWTTLTALLGGDTVESLNVRAAEARAAAEEAATGLDPIELGTTPVLDPATLASLATAAAEAAGTSREHAGKVAEFTMSLPDVADAEEALADANAELARVRGLETVLDRTREFMTAAQERVHKDIAPALQARLQAWLPVVTSGRYTEATVNPQSLIVQVRGASGSWRQASLLSHGTAEQIYLLLRLALVEHLTAGHDSCPLLLDDVTVHADTTRTMEVLALLGQVAQQRQVILFTQEDLVTDWARANQGGVVGKVIELDQPIPA